MIFIIINWIIYFSLPRADALRLRFNATLLSRRLSLLDDEDELELDELDELEELEREPEDELESEELLNYIK